MSHGVISEIRGHFRAFGFDLDDLDDNEIEQAIVDMQRTVRRFGVSAPEAVAAFRKLSTADSSGAPAADQDDAG